MTPLELLKLARDDYDLQEKLYNSLILGQRFYIGIAGLLAGASLSLADLEMARKGAFSSWLVLAAAAVFWFFILRVMWQLFRMIMGEPWTMPQSLDQYLKWKSERLKQIGGGEFDTGTKTPAEFAEDEMLCEMAAAYADSTSINREGNLSRQQRVQKIGRFLLLAVVALGLQGVAKGLYSYSHGTERAKTSTATSSPASAG